jgi:undecaprenyl-diphosphatase
MTLSLFWQAILLALIQGVTELFPVSSLGHAVILPDLFSWTISQDEETWLPFLVVMHLGTAVALLIYFWRDWFDFGMAVVFNKGPRPAEERRLFWRVVVATIPAVILGGIFEKNLRHLFSSDTVWIVCIFLMVNGVILFAADRIKRPAEKSIDALTWKDALIIGLWQCGALIPGISRSGTTMVGGFRAGLNHADAARFSFLTATPIILGATALELPKLLKHHQKVATATSGMSMLELSLIAGVVAGIAAYAALWALMRWFKRHDFKAFDPFAFYCLGAGLLFLVIELLP